MGYPGQVFDKRTFFFEKIRGRVCLSTQKVDKTGFKILVRSRDKEREKILYPSHDVLRASFLYHCVAYRQGFQNILGLCMIWKGQDVKNSNGRQGLAKKYLFFMTISVSPYLNLAENMPKRY